MSDERPGLSRRGLFGLFTRGFKEPADERRDAPELTPAPPRAAPEPGTFDAAPEFEAVRRDADVRFVAEPHAPGEWLIHLGDIDLAVGSSVKLDSEDLGEPLVLVRVFEHHWAACSSECPLDGSDVLWDAAADRLGCPACGTLWRLDGAWMEGPADYDVASFIVTAHEGIVRIVAA